MRNSLAMHVNKHDVVLHKQDCIAGMRERLESNSVDVVVTSPPYNLGVKYGEYDDTEPRHSYLRWLDRWAEIVCDVLKDDGSLFLNVGSKPSDPAVPFGVLRAMQNHFKLQNVIHWIKSITIQKEDIGDYAERGVKGDVSIGHYKPINSTRFLNDNHEYIFHLTKHGDVKLDRLAIGVEYQDKTNVRRWRDGKSDVRCRGNIWFAPYKTIHSRDDDRPHPATFPVKIPKMCIQLHGLRKTHLVVDPFLGIGHTALACVELGVDFVGFEIDTQYFAQARRTIQHATKNK